MAVSDTFIPPKYVKTVVIGLQSQVHSQLQSYSQIQCTYIYIKYHYNRLYLGRLVHFCMNARLIGISVNSDRGLTVQHVLLTPSVLEVFLDRKLALCWGKLVLLSRPKEVSRHNGIYLFWHGLTTSPNHNQGSIKYQVYVAKSLKPHSIVIIHRVPNTLAHVKVVFPSREALLAGPTPDQTHLLECLDTWPSFSLACLHGRLAVAHFFQNVARLPEPRSLQNKRKLNYLRRLISYNNLNHIILIVKMPAPPFPPPPSSFLDVENPG